MKKLLIIQTLFSFQLLFGQYLLTDGSNYMTGGLNVQREGYSSIELKSNTGSFIDFHSTITSDFDGRIIWNYNNNNRFTIYGNTQFNNSLTLLGNLETASSSWIFNKNNSQDATIWITNPSSGPSSTGHYYFKAFDYWGAYLHFKGTGDNGNEKLNVTFDGKVGIGTDNPSSNLDVNGEIAWGSQGAKLTTNQGAAIELRGSGIPFIDFSNDQSTDYDVRMILKNDDFLQIDGGNVGIGTSQSGSHRLAVEGSIGAREIKVEASGWSDFVFEKEYELRTLEEVEQYIGEKGHLPEIPSETDVSESGINLGEMNAKLLQKIEELTLYLIEQNKQNQAQQAKIEQLEKKISQLENY